MTITMEDVAEKAGVSKATVSRIINNVPNSASKETIERVNRVIDELGYVSNSLAASLKTLKSRTIGLIVGDIGNPFFGLIIKGIEKTLQGSGYSLILANSDYLYEKEEEFIQVFLERQVDALIIAPCEQKNYVEENNIARMINRGVQVVLIDNFIPGFDVDHVVVDNYRASYNATKYLIELGHRKIAMITGPYERTTATKRRDGFVAALTEQNVDITPELVIEGDYSIESGYRGVNKLLQREDIPTAIFVANNFMTVGALRAVNDKGLRVPEDISILGFDDMYWYTITRPSLTAIKQPALDIGRVAAERILLKLNRKRQPAPQRIELKTELIVRESTASPKTKGG